jgi:hypothetical protein
MDTKYFMEKATLCVRLAEQLPLSNSGRGTLLDIAEDFRKRAVVLEPASGRPNFRQT